MQVTRRVATKSLLSAAAAVPALPSIALGFSAAAADGPLERIKTQVCVVGGGSSGIGAALAAARGEAQVVLVERESILGGTSTCAWVHTWEPTTGADGIPREIYGLMKRDPLGVTYPEYESGAPRRGGRGLPFEPRALNYTARELLDAAGCRTLLATTFCRAQVQGDRVEAVEAWFAGKRLLIEAEVFIDCTADGDLSAAAGCEFHLGEDPKSLYGEPSAPEKAEMHLNAMTLCYRITNTGVPQKPYLPPGVREGSCPPWVHIVVLPNGDHLLNPVDMIDGNAILVDDYSRIMHEAQRRVLAHFYGLQRVDPKRGQSFTRLAPQGYSTWTIVGVAPRIGVRETRRILGDYVLTELDCRNGLGGQKHADIIAITDHAVDVHGRKGMIYELPNGAYGVPYRCLLPRGVRNLLVASRAASFSHVAASSCRLCRTVMMLGQAAGTAAALCVKDHLPPRQVDVPKLQSLLKSAGVAISAPT